MSPALFQWSGGDTNQFFYFTWPYSHSSLQNIISLGWTNTFYPAYLSEQQTLLYTEMSSSLKEQFDKLTFLNEIPDPLPCCTLALIDFLRASTGHENHAQGHEFDALCAWAWNSCPFMLGMIFMPSSCPNIHFSCPWHHLLLGHDEGMTKEQIQRSLWQNILFSLVNTFTIQIHIQVRRIY